MMKVKSQNFIYVYKDPPISFPAGVNHDVH